MLYNPACCLIMFKSTEISRLIKTMNVSGIHFISGEILLSELRQIISRKPFHEELDFRLTFFK